MNFITDDELSVVEGAGFWLVLLGVAWYVADNWDRAQAGYQAGQQAGSYYP